MAALAAFATGATLLQFCARLPPAPGALALLALVLVAAVAALSAFGERARFASAEIPAPHSRWSVAAVLHAAMGVIASAALGFCYAAWRADVRLADALPAAW
jgi:competence protein ComEC